MHDTISNLDGAVNRGHIHNAFEEAITGAGPAGYLERGFICLKV